MKALPINMNTSRKLIEHHLPISNWLKLTWLLFSSIMPFYLGSTQQFELQGVANEVAISAESEYNTAVYGRSVGAGQTPRKNKSACC